MNSTYSIIGTMSGTSLDGVDVAHLVTDGESVLRPGKTSLTDYSEADRELIRKVFHEITRREDKHDRSGIIGEAEDAVTRTYVSALTRLLEQIDEPVDLIGFHGQTIIHLPDEGITVQIGDPQALADAVGVPVVCDLRQNDVRNGGQGAPLAPIFHYGLVQSLGAELPAMFINIGGVANVTFMDQNNNLLAFDTGPGNALMDDYMLAHFGERMDVDGRIARKGRIDTSCIAEFMRHPFFEIPPPKSLDRLQFHEWAMGLVRHLSPSDAMATLNAFTTQALGMAMKWFPQRPVTFIASGGGVKNPVLMHSLAGHMISDVQTTSDLGWDDVFIEANAFAYLAARHARGLSISFPGTTGVKVPLTGGRTVYPR